MEVGSLSEKLISFGIPILFVLFVMIFSFNKMKKNLASVNKKYRFGAIITGLLMSIPILLLFSSFSFGPEIAKYFGVETHILFIGSFLLMLILFYILSSYMYVPIDKEKHLSDLNMKRAAYRGWKYYILENPYETLVKSFTLPSWTGRIPSTEEFVNWNEKAKVNPPVKIQWLIIFITYISTTCGLAIVGYFFKLRFLAMINLIFITFIIFSMVIASPVFKFISFCEKVLSKNLRKTFEFNQAQKFVFYNFAYIAIITLIFTLLIRIKHN